jgi:cell division protein FtsQ
MPFQKSKFLLRLLTVLAVVVAIILGMAIFFKVKHVEISGVNKYSRFTVEQASGLRKGENLLTLSHSQISSRIINELRYVEEVRVGIKLPNTVKLHIKEVAVSYAVQAADENWWLISAAGRVLDPVSFADAQGHTQIIGVRLSAPVAGQNAVAEEPQQNAVGEAVTEEATPVTVTGRERLQLVTEILQQLEDCEILGEMDSVDVTNIGHITLSYDERITIDLGDGNNLEIKIKSVKNALQDPELGEYAEGNMDASFTIWPDRVAISTLEP